MWLEFTFFSLTVLWLWKGIRVVRQDEAVILETLGKFTKILPPSIQVWIPLFQRLRSVEWRFSRAELGSFDEFVGSGIPLSELRYDPETLACKTKDGISIDVDLVVNFKITDARKAAYSTRNLFGYIEDCVLTELNSVVRQQEHQSITPDSIVAGLALSHLNTLVADAGCLFTRVSVQAIQLPAEIQQTNERIVAERRAVQAKLLRLEQEKQHHAGMEALREKELSVNQKIERQQQAHQRQLALEKAEAQAKEMQLLSDAEAYVAAQKLASSVKARQAELAQFSEESRALEQHPQLLAYRTQELSTRAWAQLSAGAGSRLVVAPLSALDAVARMPLLEALKAN